MSEYNNVFQCAQCGQCCDGQGGIVLSPRDLFRLCKFLRQPAAAVIAAYAEISNGKLKIRSGPDGRCIFFEAGRGCGVHEGKPAICRAWPFFKGNIEDEISFEMAKDYCPGINREASFTEFAAAGMAYLRENRLGASDGLYEANSLLIADSNNSDR